MRNVPWGFFHVTSALLKPRLLCETSTGSLSVAGFWNPGRLA